MNGFSQRNWWQALAFVSLAISLGCNAKSDSPDEPNLDSNPASSANLESNSQPDAKVGLDAKAILAATIERYANANTYSDQAKLYLSYQLEGRKIQEPQRWSTAWDRQGRLAAELFNGKIRCNDGLLSCYVYDIETANLDNQHLLMAYDQQLPISQLFRDSIAKHFLGGYSELPLDESDLISHPKLLPPPLSLLTNQVRNGWFQTPSALERFADETIDKQACYVIRMKFQGMTSDAWIDKSTHALVQVSLPLMLLAGEVVTSPEISDVVLMAKFHQAQFDVAIDVAKFEHQPFKDSTLVKKFVALPETFPSKLIGKTAPKFNLVNQAGKPTVEAEFSGRVTTLLWLAGQPSYVAMEQLDQLASSLPADTFQFGAVYSDSELKAPGTGSIEVENTLAAAIKNVNCPVYYDPMLAASTALQVKAIPSVIVLGKDSKVQFAKALTNQNWLSDVKAAVERVAEGEDVAAEMQREYQRFISSYQQQLATVSASDLIEKPAGVASQVSSGGGSKRKSDRGIRLRPAKRWANSEFQKAGNILVLPEIASESQHAALVAFDGWRTVVGLDVEGATRYRKSLELPEGAAANLVRVGLDQNGRHLFVVFSALSKQLYLFDDEWKPAGVYPKFGDVNAGVQDCQLTDLNGDGVAELVVAFAGQTGIQLVDPKTLQGEPISAVEASSLKGLGSDLVVAGQGKIGLLKTGLTNVEETELKFRRVETNSELLCGLGVTSNGQWNAVGFDNELKRIWTLSIGSQFFETEIEPIVVAQAESGEFIWAIADTGNAVHLVSGEGKWLGDFQSESKLGGVALQTVRDQVRLLISNESGIECWDLNLKASPMQQISIRK
jgi:hypothetical protein